MSVSPGRAAFARAALGSYKTRKSPGEYVNVSVFSESETAKTNRSREERDDTERRLAAAANANVKTTRCSTFTSPASADEVTSPLTMASDTTLGLSPFTDATLTPRSAQSTSGAATEATGAAGFWAAGSSNHPNPNPNPFPRELPSPEPWPYTNPSSSSSRSISPYTPAACDASEAGSASADTLDDADDQSTLSGRSYSGRAHDPHVDFGADAPLVAANLAVRSSIIVAGPGEGLPLSAKLAVLPDGTRSDFFVSTKEGHVHTFAIDLPVGVNAAATGETQVWVCEGPGLEPGLEPEPEPEPEPVPVFWLKCQKQPQRLRWQFLLPRPHPPLPHPHPRQSPSPASPLLRAQSDEKRPTPRTTSRPAVRVQTALLHKAASATATATANMPGFLLLLVPGSCWQ